MSNCMVTTASYPPCLQRAWCLHSSCWRWFSWRELRRPSAGDGASTSGSSQRSEAVYYRASRHMALVVNPWSIMQEGSRQGRASGRRLILQAPFWISLAAACGILSGGPAHALVPARIDLSKIPQRAFDPTDQRLRDAAKVFEQALNATTIDDEDRLWTEVIQKYGELEAEWVPDILSRAWGNLGNCRSRQGKMEQALDDFDRAIELAPYAVDPVLNRGVVLESLGRYDEAAADYKAVLSVHPNDPAAWNNLGNVQAAMRKWDEAIFDYQRAVQLAPEFSFAAANYALALYQVGRDNEAIRQFRSLLRKYPEFPDVRAALAVSLYAQGLTAEAENNWGRLEDGRYRDRNWVRNTRRWPERLTAALEDFLDVKPN